MNNKDIDSIAYLINQARKNNEPKPIVFLGAGVSISAGIPGTAQIIEDILTQFSDKPEVKKLDSNDRNYYTLMTCLNTDERHKLLRSYITSEKVKINVSHIYLAQMVKEGYIDYVLTVNFDDLFLRACAMFNFIPPVYDISILKDFTTTTLSEGSITYLHGQYHGFWLLNTGEELDKVKEYIPTVLNRICNKRTWIIVGYSGEDSIFSHITRLEHFTNELFWVGYNDNVPNDNVQERLLKKANSNASLVSGYNADSFFLRLHSELKMTTPDIFNKPFSFLKGLMSNIRDVDKDLIDEKHKNLFEKVKERFDVALKQANDAIQLYERNDSSTSLSSEDISNDRFKQQIIEAIVKGNYDEAESLKKKAANSNQEIKDILSELYYNWGTSLYKKARKKPTLELLQEANEKFQEAALLNPNDSMTYSNWGAALSELGDLTNDVQLIDKSINHYETAIKLNPLNKIALFNCGISFSRKGDLEKNEEYFQAAVEKFDRAIKLDSNDHDALVNCGTALAKLANIQKNEKLFKESIDKFEAAIKLQPNNAATYENLASAIILMTKILPKEEAVHYLNIAIENAKKVVELGFSAYNLACCYALLGDKTTALYFLQQALDKKAIDVSIVVKDDDWASYLNDEDFENIIKKYS